LAGRPILDYGAIVVRQRTLLYDATLTARETRDADADLRVGDRVLFDDLGEYVVFRIDHQEGETRYHALKSALWDDERKAFRLDMRLYAKDAVAHLWDRDPDDPRERPEPPDSLVFQATFKWEDTADDGEDIGPLIVYDPEQNEVVWESADWVRLSEAQALATEKGWRFSQDGSSACADVGDGELEQLVRQSDADARALHTEEGMRRYFGVAPGEELPELARKILDALNTHTKDPRSE